MSSAAIEVGNIVVPRQSKLHDVRKVFPAIRDGQQLKVVSTQKGVYGSRKVVFCIAEPGGEPFALWSPQLKKLTGSKPVDPKWGR